MRGTGNPYYFTQFTTITFRYQKTMMSKKLLRVTQLINNFVTMDIITLLMFYKATYMYMLLKHLKI